MDRRLQNFFEESSCACMIEDAINSINTLELLPEGSCSTSQTLTRLLSLQILVSTTRSFARRQQAVQAIDNGPFRIIGQGQCGTVYENPVNLTVLKVAREEVWKAALWNDYIKHQKVLEAFGKAGIVSVLVPNTVHYVPKDGPSHDQHWWNEVGSRFPEGSALSDVLITERIPPLSKPIREAIIDEYFPDEQKLQAKGNPGNKDCLVRLYLGRRRNLSRKAPKNFTLRNYCLHLDQMESLNIPVFEIGQHIAEALAIMHWGAKVDANDVEFVLGSAPGYTSAFVTRILTYEDLKELRPGTATRTLVAPLRDFPKRSTHVWLLDFNRCKDISMDMAGVDKAVRAFYQNDPYFPRPLATGSLDQELWVKFKSHYLSYSETLLKRDGASLDVLNLPGAFIEKAIEEQQKRLEEQAAALRRLAERGEC